MIKLETKMGKISVDICGTGAEILADLAIIIDEVLAHLSDGDANVKQYMLMCVMDTMLDEE